MHLRAFRKLPSDADPQWEPPVRPFLHGRKTRPWGRMHWPRVDWVRSRAELFRPQAWIPPTPSKLPPLLCHVLEEWGGKPKTEMNPETSARCYKQSSFALCPLTPYLAFPQPHPLPSQPPSVRGFELRKLAWFSFPTFWHCKAPNKGHNGGAWQFRSTSARNLTWGKLTLSLH